MNPSPRSRFVAALLACAGSLLFVGCQSSTSPALNRGVAASDSIQSAADTVARARAQIDVTTAALGVMVDRPDDVPAQYKAVLTELGKLQSGVADIEKSAAELRVKGDRYLADWASQIARIQDKELQDAAFIRRAAVSADLQRIFLRHQTVKSTYSPYLRSLADIQTVLGADMSASGLATVRPFVAKATQEAEPVKTALDQLAADFRTVGQKLQPGGF